MRRHILHPGASIALAVTFISVNFTSLCPLQMPAAKSQGSPVLSLGGCKSGIPTGPSAGAIICWDNSQNSGKHCTYYHTLFYKIQMKNHMGRYIGQGLEGPQHRTVCPHGVEVPLSQHVCAFTNLETPGSPLFRDFDQGFIPWV